MLNYKGVTLKILILSSIAVTVTRLEVFKILENLGKLMLMLMLMLKVKVKFAII